jgi:hypothetical protein
MLGRDERAGFPEGTAILDPGRPLRGPQPGAGAGPGRRLRRLGRVVRTPVLVVAAVVVFNVVFPKLVANERPTVLSQSGTISVGSGIPRDPAAGPVPAWDQVDVELFMDSCGHSEPPQVCQCQAQALQPYYSGEEALAYADKQGGSRAVLPQRYKDVLVRCSQGY